MRNGTKIVYKKFDCREFGDTVIITLRYLTTNNIPAEGRKPRFRCNNQDVCKIVKQQVGQTITYKWDNCPGYKQYGQ